MLGKALARAVAPCAEPGSTEVRADGSSRMRFLASRTFSTSLCTSIVLNEGGWGSISASVGETTPGTLCGREKCISYCALGSRSNIACSRRMRSVSVRRSSESGGGPSFNSPFEELNVFGLGMTEALVAWVLLGMSDDRSPVDSSHALGDRVVVLAEVTMKI